MWNAFSLCPICVVLNIRDWFTRSHPSKGENYTGNRNESCKCERAMKAMHERILVLMNDKVNIRTWLDYKSIVNVAIKFRFFMLMQLFSALACHRNVQDDLRRYKLCIIFYNTEILIIYSVRLRSTNAEILEGPLLPNFAV